MKTPNTTNLLGNQSKRFPFRALLAAVLLAGAVGATSGCVAVVAAGAAGAGVAWVRGALETNLDGDVEHVFHAAQKAVADLQITKVSESSSAVDARLIARTALDKRVEIKIEKSGSVTKVSIRVGLIGDEALSLSILDHIKKHL